MKWGVAVKLSSRYSEIVFYVSVLSTSLSSVCPTNGARFAENLLYTNTIYFTGGHFELFETLRFVRCVHFPTCARACTWLVEHLNQIQKRE